MKNYAVARCVNGQFSYSRQRFGSVQDAVSAALEHFQCERRQYFIVDMNDQAENVLAAIILSDGSVMFEAH